MKTVTWIHPESLAVAGYGAKKEGDKFEVPDELAIQLKEQGFVKINRGESSESKEDKKEKRGRK